MEKIRIEKGKSLREQSGEVQRKLIRQFLDSEYNYLESFLRHEYDIKLAR